MTPPTPDLVSGPALRYEWKEASLPPPHHYEFTIVAGANGQGLIEFVPDYPSAETPVWKRGFGVELETLSRLVADLANQAVAESEAGEVRVGGSVEELQVTTASGAQRVIQLEDHSGAELRRRIRSLVPEAVWKELDSLRRAYVGGSGGSIH